MFEITIVGAIALKIIMLFAATGLLGIIFLWPVGDKPVKSEAKVAFVVVLTIVAGFILELIKIT